MSNIQIRVKISSFDHKVLEEAVKKLSQVVLKTGSTIIGPIPLPRKYKIFDLRRSTFVYSKHADKIESRSHRRLIIIHNISPDVINSLSTLSLPAGVDIAIETRTVNA